MKILTTFCFILITFWAKANIKIEKDTVDTDLYQELLRKGKKEIGLFNVYTLDDKYYFEIPDTLLERDMLMVTRYAKTAMNMGYAGETLDERVLVWNRRDSKTIDLQSKSFKKIASKQCDMSESVSSITFPAIIASLEIDAYNTDSSSMIIDVTDLYQTDLLAFGLNKAQKKKYAIGSLKSKSSYLTKIKSYPTNVDVRSIKTYSAQESAKTNMEGLSVVSLEIHNSLLLLPQRTMKTRSFDERIGLFYQVQYDYGLSQSQKATRTRYVKRWRMEPQDTALYFAGSLVEPVKPIVYYLSPSIPSHLVKYIKQGVEDWQIAFEKAGFKNAIIAKAFPSKEENPDFDPFDAKYSIIEYFASATENAYGPHVSDPRSGEIINSHICVFHNVLKLLHDWYMIQCAPTDKRAQKMVFDEELMGRLLRYLICHEVGHTLGLAHNFGASNAFPVDSLRSASFTKKYGVSASIMDYSRFNYVAQPQDTGVCKFPIVGVYDKYAIDWTYRYLSENLSKEEEEKILRDYITSKSDDPNYRFIKQSFFDNDPRAQSEDIGDNAMQSAAYGIKNLQIVAENLGEWCIVEGENNDDLKLLYDKMLKQWAKYLDHVSSNLGGIYENYKTVDQKGTVYGVVPKEIKKEALDFYKEYFFKTPMWLINQPYIQKFRDISLNNRKFSEVQNRLATSLLGLNIIINIEHEFVNHPEIAYNPEQYLKDVRKMFWSTLYDDVKLDYYNAQMQRSYLNQCKWLLNFGDQGDDVIFYLMNFRTSIRAELQELKKDLNKKIKRGKSDFENQHYKDCVKHIDSFIYPKSR